MKIRFYLKDPKAVKSSSIFASISYDTQRMKYYLPESIDPKSWNSKKQEAKSGYYESSELNTRLIGYKRDIAKTFNLLSEDGIPSITLFKQRLDILYKRIESLKIEFYQFAEDLIKKTQLGQRISKDGTVVNVRSAYELARVVEHLKGFEKQWRRKICFENFDHDFYTDFTSYLNDQNESLNTVGKRVKDLKTILNTALDKKITKYDDFRRFNILKEEASNIALTESELSAIENLDLSSQPIGLQHTRDLFVICCHTGLRHSDASRLNEFFTVKDGLLHGDQKKTGGKVVIPIHNSVAAIIKKYDGRFPQASANQVENRNLKVIANLVDALREGVESKAQTKGGVKTYKKQSRADMVCTHTGRRTMATLAYKEGLPTISIMALTGHKTEKSFLNYLKITKEEHAITVANYWNRKNNLKAI